MQERFGPLGWLGRVERQDLLLDEFLVQHDMENCYMWTFTIGRTTPSARCSSAPHMNGHSRYAV